jgi:hypothetical protein
VVIFVGLCTTGRAVLTLLYITSFYESYTQELPTRFKKDIVRAAKVDETEFVAFEGLERVISNIGASSSVSRDDVETIFLELGENGYIPAESMMKIL